MKKIVLSTIAALTIGTVAAQAAAFTLYQDANGQVFTKPGADRTEMVITTDMVTNKVQKDEAYSTPRTVKLSKEDKAELKQDILAEVKKATPLYAKADKLKFSALAYLGYTLDDYDNGVADNGDNFKKDTSDFEIRRAYFQLKAYLLEDPKSYYRVTFDISKDVTGDEKVRAKYTYLYLNEVLPSTGVELGLVHRPWHDYEEHNAWYYRSISKVLIEDKKTGPDLSNSADFGVMFKTKTKYFDADYGVFNGEGYHSTSNSNGMSFEWRTTAHLLGVNGKDKQKEKTYWDASFFGQYNKEHKTKTDAVTNNATYEDLIFMGLHTVYNQPDFLVSAQYVYSKDTRDNTIAYGTGAGQVSDVSAQSGDGYSVNAEYRLGSEKQFSVLGRYDSWTPKKGADVNSADINKEFDNTSYIIGGAWEQNKNVQWLTNVIVTDNDAGSSKEKENGTQYMVTARVKF